MTRRDLVRNLVTYAIAAAILWWIARDIDPGRLASAFAAADLWIFIPVSVGGFLMWYLGETLLWSRLFLISTNKPPSARCCRSTPRSIERPARALFPTGV